MHTDRAWLALPLALAALSGCTEGFATGDRPVADFGEANRQTMMAQVIDPEPQYDTLVPPSSAGHAAQAVDRYNSDAVKQPEDVQVTSTFTGDN